MQTLQKRLAALGLHSLKEWFQLHPGQQFRLMLSNNTAACFCPINDKVIIEMAPAYIDERGVPQRESFVDSKGVRWQTLLVFYEKTTYRKYTLQGSRLLSPEDMEKAFIEAEMSYKNEKSKAFRPGYIFDFIEFWNLKRGAR
jgi:hypothetical protein